MDNSFFTYKKLKGGPLESLLNLPVLSANLEKSLKLDNTLRGKHKEQRNRRKYLDFNFQYLGLQIT